ncbi:hypothetical protein H8D30_05450 [bacterium]|nr:hypothetical protein [bacterium]
MAQAFTPGLMRGSGILIRKVRRLPLKGEILVEKGDVVKASDVVARTELPGPVQVLKISHRLGCQPDELPDLMTVGVGDWVEKGEKIAESKGFWGFFKSEYLATASGKVDSISRVNGQVYLRGKPTPVEVEAYVAGTIVEIIEEEGVVVETTATVVQGIFGVGGEEGGTLMIGVDSPSETLGAEGITAEMEGAVVVVGAGLELETIVRAQEVGVAALVGGAIHDKDLRALLGVDIGVAITGNEDLGITLVVTEGFGRLPMDGGTWKLLVASAGRLASINGATQIRAGVLRPEILVPTPDLKGILHADEGGMGLDVGSRIVVIRTPYFGRAGVVTQLVVEPQQVESEARVRVLGVRFDDGEEAIVPRANVERLEV